MTDPDEPVSGVARPQWTAPPTDLRLTGTDVHVWLTDVRELGAELGPAASLLGREEQARAARFRFERDRRQYVVAHGALRVILSRYLHVTPGEIEFGTGEAGKPFVHSPTDPPVRFSLSHSGDVVLCAITRNRMVGVDVERMRPTTDAEQVAGFFSPREREFLAAMPDSMRLSGFYVCWTCKEAYLKASGTGLSSPLDAFDVLYRDADGACRAGVRMPGEAERWGVYPFVPGEGYLAAFVVEGQGGKGRFWRFPPAWPD